MHSFYLIANKTITTVAAMVMHMIATVMDTPMMPTYTLVLSDGPPGTATGCETAIESN